jgi:hypothetical protein
VTTVDRYMSTIFVVLALLLGALVVLPGRPSTLALVLGVALAASLFVSSLRGVYWAPLQMANLPDRCLGTAVGLISVVGFLPDAFLFLVYGELLDRYAHAPATGFRLLFASLIGFAVVGAACARRFRRYSCPHAPARPRRAAGLVPRQPPAHARLVRDPGA